MKLSIVDVFAEAVYQGNQLAVVEDAAGLSTSRMQTIAREMNFSETTFVTARSEGRAAVRIFTPGEELPFAGHPTLGTAWVLTRGAAPITLNLVAGAVPVRFHKGIAWLTPPPVREGPAIEVTEAAALLGLATADLDPDFDTQVLDCGPVFPMIGVRSLAALKRVKVDLDVQRSLGVAGFPFAFCRGGYSPGVDFAARMQFFDGSLLREDPATGSANAAFAHYLRARGFTGGRIVEQGFEIDRPSRIYLDIGAELSVGGKVWPVLEGQLIQ
ncbi:MAG: PhzF family phenazine biosynthesis protein [Pseudomonadales bacterium]